MSPGFSLPLLTDNSATNRKTETQNPTPENRSQVPEGPSNLWTYLQRDESFERTALGETSARHPDAVARDLEEWERQWNALGQRDQ
jgi:hypothetical protein